MRKWLWERVLPMWAKETLLRENRRLSEENAALEQENARLRSYIRGLRLGLRCRIREGNNEKN